MKQGGNHAFGSRPSPRQRWGRNSGFTIVEVLIVLAATGLLFIMAIVVISGRQNQTEFDTAIHQVPQTIQQIINETASGYFPNSNNFTCTPGISLPPSISAGSAAGQGTNAGCVFLGKVLQFGAGDLNPSQYVTWPLAGNQSGQVLWSTTPSVAAYPQPIPSLKITQSFDYGLAAAKMYYNGVATNGTSGVGFLAGDNSGTISTAGAGGLNNGSQQLSLYAITGTQVGSTTTAQMTTSLTSGTTAASYHYTQVQNVELCLNSGSTNQHGLITIGNENGLTVDLSIGAGSC